MFKNIIWDFDGTLFDTYPCMVYAFKEALKEIGVDEDESEILKYLKISVGDAINHFTELYPINEGFSERFHYYQKTYPAEKVLPFKFSREICEEFKNKGIRNFILTHRDESIFEYLKFHNMTDCFTEVGTKQNNFKRKPDPEGFLYFVEKYNLNKDEVLAIGDREIDILGAKNAGVKTCLYNTNNVDCTLKPDFIITSLNQLQEII